MSASNAASRTTFAESVRAFMPRVEYRAPTTEDEKEEIYRLRYSAYLREGALSPGAPEIFTDKYDKTPNASLVGLYIDNRLASSIRIHHVNRETPDCPAMMVFSDYLRPLIESGMTVVDPTRFVIDGTAARLYPKLAYLTVRVPFMACEHFDADIALATVRAEHQPFYKRIFGYGVICPPRPYPSLSTPISLMAVNFHQFRERAVTRYPFLRSTEAERRAIFGEHSNLRRGGKVANALRAALAVGP